MKTYEIHLRRMSWITVTVEAESREEASELAYEQIDDNRCGIGDSDWELEHIEELPENG